MSDNIPDPEPGCSVDGCERANCDRCGYHTYLEEYVGGMRFCALCAGVPTDNTDAPIRTICYVGNYLLDAMDLMTRRDTQFALLGHSADLKDILKEIGQIAGGHE